MQKLKRPNELKLKLKLILPIFFEHFAYKVVDHICINKDFMINQQNLMLNQNLACELDFKPNAQSVI